MLLVQGLYFFGLGPVSLEVPANQSISINGSSGSGKTLLLRAIADLDPHRGEIRLFDVLQDSVSGSSWRQQIGFLNADNVFWEDTVQQHFSHTDHDLLEEYSDHLDLPNNILKQSLSTLSSGEKQRIAIIRLLINKPRALLLDESTSHLDPDAKIQVESLVQTYQKQNQCPVIWVSHDKPQRQRVAARHYQMRDGQLAEISI